MEDIAVSILIPTYNHENYISKAIDSVFLQDTKHNFEVLVGDDVSTDSTREVLKNLEKKYDSRLKVYYREFNLGRSNEKLDNHMDLYHKANGRYVIFLEGDDYWIDYNKINEQVDFLENNKDYIAVAHNCIVVDQYGNKREELYPECKDEEYTLKHYVKGILPGQLATLLMRNIYRLNNFDTQMWEKRLVPGDRIFYFTLLSYGKIKCIQKPMSAYRYVTSSGSSYSATVVYDFFYDEYWHRELALFARKGNKRTFVLCSNVLYLNCLFKGIRHKNINFKEALKYAENMRIDVLACLYFLYEYTPIYINKALLKYFGIGKKII